MAIKDSSGTVFYKATQLPESAGFTLLAEVVVVVGQGRGVGNICMSKSGALFTVQGFN